MQSYNTRIQLKNDSVEAWEEQKDFIPLKGEIILYNDNRQLKIGDGVTPLSNLPYYRPHDNEFNVIYNNIESIWEYLGQEGVIPETNLGLYGIYVDMPNKVFTRLGRAKGWSPEDFTQNSFYGQIRRCNLADDGTVNAYYGDANYAEDGSNGQVMVEIPKFRYVVRAEVLEEIDDLTTVMRKGRYYVTQDITLEGYKTHPAFIDANGNELEHIYISAYEGCLWDNSVGDYDLTDSGITIDVNADKLSSIAGAKPVNGLASVLTRTNAEACANNRGEGWHCQGILEISAIQMLMLIEQGVWNFQESLGLGVTNITDNSSYNCSSLTGSTSSLGNNSGMATETINEIGGVQTVQTANGKVSVSWRGIENPYGNIWEHICGMTIYGNGNMKGGRPYICTNRNYKDFTAIADCPNNYTAINFCIPNSSNYISAFGYDINYDWLFIPGENTGANSSLPVGDYVYVTANLNGLRTAHLGGGWYNGSSAGLFDWILNNGVGNRSRYIGARVVYIPMV